MIDVGRYTYNGPDCNDGDGWVDPINLIFVGYDARTVAAVKDHLRRDDHGGFAYSHGSNQWFRTHGFGCSLRDDQANSGDPFGIDQVHVRFERGRLASGEPDTDPEFGPYVVAAAHREDVILWPPSCWDTLHAVKGNELEPPGGFNMGRNYIVDSLTLMANDGIAHDPLGHELVDTQYWGNIHPFRQCDGEYAWSDGWVDFVSMPPQVGPGGGDCRSRGFCGV